MGDEEQRKLLPKGKAWPFGIAFIVLGIIVWVADAVVFAPTGFPGQQLFVYAIVGLIFVVSGAYTAFVGYSKPNSNSG